MSTPVTSSSLFVVSGGGRGITARCVVGLAQRYGCRFLLLGRSSIDEAEPSWAHGCHDSHELQRRIVDAAGDRPTPLQVRRRLEGILAHREIRATLDAVRGAGGEATYRAVDITAATALREVLDEALDARGPVTGIIHAAGVLADKPIERKTLDDFERVYAPKVRGLINLLACLPPDRLHHVVLFSSAAAFYGNPGQADYAIANEILNKAAYYLSSAYPACQVLAIDWGPWDGGMVTPELKKHFSNRGVRLISADGGVQVFLELLASDPPSPQVVVGTGRPAPVVPDPNRRMRRHTVRRRLTLDANPFLRDHVIAGRPVLPAVCAAAWIAHSCEEVFPGFRTVCVDDPIVLKGIVFDDELAAEYVLEIEPVHWDDEEAVCDGKIWSSASPGSAAHSGPAVRYHYSGRVTLRTGFEATPTEAPFLPPPDDAAVERASLYDGHVLFHGPAFQGVQRVLRADPHGLTMECCLAPIPPADQGQFPVRSINPFIADVQLQSQVIWARLFRDAMSLPVRGTRYEYFRPIEFGQPFYVCLTIRSADAYRTVADITSYDRDGQVAMRFLGSETSNVRLGETVHAVTPR